MRNCTECGAEMREGYVIDDGAEYYCTDGCLRINYTPEEWAAIYESEWGYWTEWPEDDGSGATETTYQDGRSEEQKKYARGEFGEMADAIASLSKRMWSAPIASRLTFGGESFTLDERKALEVMRAELHMMHHRIVTLAEDIAP